MKEEIKLSDHFGYRKLMRFTMPSIVMLIFTSIYGVVDGLFVSNFVGKTSFAAVNLIMPVLMILGCVGFMFGTGGGALIAMSLGEGKKEKASHIFSFIVALKEFPNREKTKLKNITSIFKLSKYQPTGTLPVINVNAPLLSVA